MKDIDPLVKAVLPDIVTLRHDLHQHPELGYEEYRTARRVLEHLSTNPDLDLRTGVGETGIVATLGAEKSGPCVALRADMDALPIEETSDLPYKSQIPGKMHACGHDGHTSCLVGAAKVLAQCTNDLEGPVKFIFQPAEEVGAGGRRLCEEGALENPKPEAIFGLHGAPGLPQGQIGTCHGAFLASADTFEIDIEGQGTHAAFPHTGIDPVLIASQIVVALQTIVSRNIDPLSPAVVTVGQIIAGTATNVIPSTAQLRGTVRALDEDMRAHVLERVVHIATHVAESMNGSAEVHIENGYPILNNNPRAKQTLETIITESNTAKIVDLSPIMGAEDFAFYAEQIPAMFCMLGLLPQGHRSAPGLHQSDFDFADGALPYGIKMHVEIARNFARVWNSS